jgi:hypothetical protein
MSLLLYTTLLNNYLSQYSLLGSTLKQNYEGPVPCDVAHGNRLPLSQPHSLLPKKRVALI